MTYLYYGWAIDGGAASPSADAINREYVLPTVESVLEARPELASSYPGVRSDAAVRLYFLGHGMLLTHGVVYSTSGPGRYPSLELVPIVEETPLNKVIWGRPIDAVAFAVRDPVIFDIVSYTHGVSTGGNMVTLNTIVCHHIDREADFLRLLRDELERARLGPPGPAFDGETLMAGLSYVALQPYLAHDVHGAIAEFMKDWRDTSYIHEVGHIFSKQAGLAPTGQSGEEEALAYLTELRYGGRPHYTLRTMFSMEVTPGDRPHGEGMKIVFAAFARHIRDAKLRGDGFETIDVGAPAELLTSDAVNRIVWQFPRLRTDEIRRLADRVFEDKYRPRVKE